MGYYDDVTLLIGKTLTSIYQTSYQGDECLLFTTSDGEQYRMCHSQDCCESVYLDDVNGDFEDLVGTPILVAEERTNSDSHPDGITPEYQPESFTWTFYEFGTIKGSVSLRWYGTSNGYYSESVNFRKVD
jgi:hypothetical protein